ncbi:bacillithiol biosynthesis cysteine-adding enzyme BshC [Vicingaceae bacterium]|nr:bacillithiol biosynthesis cysteine-adding enzyme BshC [Vicingaceae bacterium]
MKTDCISFEDSGYFSKIILDYLAKGSDLENFYSLHPILDNFEHAIANKNVTRENRGILVESIKGQYKKDGVKLRQDGLVLDNLNNLEANTTYTVTTGHQLCLFTGPLYFIYKIVSTLKLCQKLKSQYPEFNFVPVYWMATEDHDFEEVNHFYAGDKKFQWETDQKGAVGRMKLGELKPTVEAFGSWLTDYSTNAEELKGLFEKVYLKHDTLAAATRYLVHELFRDHGVVIVDGDDSKLKALFKPTIKKELLEEFSAKAVELQSEQLAKKYKIQVNPREINLFYLIDNSRERIVKENGAFFVNGTSISFSEEEIMFELENYPERFSPNVLLRPIYQETILPNLAYIGGGAELAYWFQLKTTFEQAQISMPILILRNSAVWLNEKQTKVFQQLEITKKQLFLTEGVLMKEWVKANSAIDLELVDEKQTQVAFYKALEKLAVGVDLSLEKHVKALASKQLNAIDQLSEKLIRAERRKATTAQQRVSFLKDTLFYNNGLQERRLNFSEIYLFQGKGMIDDLIYSFKTPAEDFLILQSDQ